MKKIESSIRINASAGIIWGILMDTANYPEWNPFIRQLSGTLETGERLEVKLQPEGDKEYIFKPLVQTLEHEQEFSWLGHLKMKGLFDGHHYFKLQPHSDGTVDFIHGEDFSGVLVKPFLSMISKKTLAGFEGMNEALKLRAEALENTNN